MTNEYNNRRFIALRPDFVLDQDGKKAYLYPMDIHDQKIFRLSPGQALSLSLFDGKKTTTEVLEQFAAIFPNANPLFPLNTINTINKLVQSKTTISGLGIDGVTMESTDPILETYSYDSQKFIISNKIFEESVLNICTSMRLGRPISILAVPTHRCQTNCIYCYADRPACKEMPIQRWQELFAEMTQLGIHLISFDNGDVIARRDGIDILEMALANEMHFMISTKSLFTKEQVNRLVSAGFMKPVRYLLRRTVQLSVDAIDDELAIRIYGSRVYKKNITTTFDNFMDYEIMPKIKGVIMPYNANQVEKIITYFYERGARRFEFVRYARSFFRHSDDNFLNEATANEVTQQMLRCFDKHPDAEIGIIKDFQRQGEIPPITLNQSDREEAWSKRAGCGGGWSTLGIYPDGRAFLCEQMAVKDEYCVGNLMQQSIEEVWNSERMLAFIYPRQEQFAGTVCEHCNDFAACHYLKGYCYRNAYFSYGTIFDAPPLCPKQNKPGLRLT